MVAMCDMLSAVKLVALCACSHIIKGCALLSRETNHYATGRKCDCHALTFCSEPFVIVCALLWHTILAVQCITKLLDLKL